jgi:hypothetical protein
LTLLDLIRDLGGGGEVEELVGGAVGTIDALHLVQHVALRQHLVEVVPHVGAVRADAVDRADAGCRVPGSEHHGAEAPGVTRSCCTTAVASLKGATAPDTVRQLGPCASTRCIMLTVITNSVVATVTATLPIFIVIEYGYYCTPATISYVRISIVRRCNEESRSELTTWGQLTTVLN